MLHTGVVDDEAGLEIVRAVHDHVRAFYQLFDIRRIDVRDDAGDVDLGVDELQFPLGRSGLGHVLAHVLLIKENLALQVALFDEIAVDDTKIPHTRASEHVGNHGPQRPAPGNNGGGSADFLLPFFADEGEQDLAVVAVDGHVESLLNGTQNPISVAVVDF